MDHLLSPATLALFLPAVFILLITPGPVVLYIVTRSIDQGRGAGLVSVLGSEIGNLVHVLAAALGLSAILLSSTLAFDIVKYLGAGYLIYLGIRKLFSPTESAPQAVERAPLRRIFFQGIAVAVLNPKTALFFFAFLPQFVDRSKGSVGLQILLLGLIMLAFAIISDSCYALAAGAAGRWLRGSALFPRIQRYVTGTVYIGLGIVALLAGGNRKA
jgi:threonine/homoserine/homoserine lactone efflux protein